MLLANISAEGWVLIITAAGAVLSQIVLQILNFLTTRQTAKQSAETSNKIDTVQDKLHEQDKLAAVAKEDLLKVTETSLAKQDELKTIAVATKEMVNGRFTAKIRESAIRARRIADLTKDPADEADANNAEAELARHIENERRAAATAVNADKA